MFHSLLRLWFELVRDWGYWGVALMMAIESTVFPLPSEVDVKKSSAKYKNGLLRVVLPKANHANGKRIEVRAM